MTYGWTGGQYSLFRALLALYLFADALLLALAQNTPLAYSLLVPALIAAVLILLGFHDRPAAIFFAAALLTFAALFPQTTSSFTRAGTLGIPLLLAIIHSLTPPAPFGSLAARRRPDPAGQWALPAPMLATWWLLLALSYLAVAIAFALSPQWHLGTAVFPATSDIPLPFARLLTWLLFAAYLAFAPLSLVKRFRPWLWLALLLLNTVVWPLAGHWPLAVSLALVHLLTFRPAWVTLPPTAAPENLFYDGRCGLCHRTVRFVLAEDPAGKRFVLAPLQGDYITTRLTDAQRAALPESLVVLTADRRLLTESAAVLHIARQLGGLWRLLAAAVTLIPRPARDALYRLIARLRHHLFAHPKTLCPIVPLDLRPRFRP